MNIRFKIDSKFQPRGDQPEAISSLVSGLNRNEKRQILMGVTGSGKTFTMAKVIEEVQRPTLILSHNKTLAAQLFGEFKTLFPKNAVEFFISYYDYYQPEAYLPTTDTFIEKDATVNEEIDKLRLRATSSLLSRNDVIVVASVSCIFGIGSPQEYLDQMISLKVGEELDRKSFFRLLIETHYRRNDLVLERGTFRVRGDTIELFPAYLENAMRIELFGDEIENIYQFEPLTGEILQEMQNLALFPAKHFVTSEDNMNNAMDKILDEMDDQVAQFEREGKLLEAQRIRQRTMFDIEMMREIGYCSGIENYSRHIDGRNSGDRPNTLLDFFPDDFLVFFDESHVSMPQIRGMYNGDRARKSMLVNYGFRLPSAYDNRPMMLKEVEAKVEQGIFVSATPADYEFELTGGAVVEQIIRPTGLLDPKIETKPTKHQVDDLIEEITERIKIGEKCLVLTLTIRMSEDLSEYLHNLNFRVKYLHSKIDAVERVKILRDLRLGEFDVLVGINLLREGLDLPEVSLVAILDADKEGFLRSEKSLFQISGRASRNVNGKVIFYADKMTDSMKKVIDETARRRKLQRVYNDKNGIIPQTVKKTRQEIMESTAVADMIQKRKKDEENRQFGAIPENLEKTTMLEFLHKEMTNAAENLEFERAAALRNEIERVKNEK